MAEDKELRAANQNTSWREKTSRTYLKGPADRLLNELGYEASVQGVAKYYQDWINTLIIDKADFDSVKNIESLGINCVSTETVMSDPQIAASLGSTLLGLKR